MGASPRPLNSPPRSKPLPNDPIARKALKPFCTWAHTGLRYTALAIIGPQTKFLYPPVTDEHRYFTQRLGSNVLGCVFLHPTSRQIFILLISSSLNTRIIL